MKGENVKLAFVCTIEGGNLRWLQICFCHKKNHKILEKILKDKQICSHAQELLQKHKFRRHLRRVPECASSFYILQRVTRAALVVLLDHRKSLATGICLSPAFSLILRPIFRY